ncbi:dihydrodipicolinate synthase family protein [Lactobacillus hamsteri]|uniref:Dihydrodipicolinate synthetase family protein n=1 Tax=Lactobacillus hamsteri DSM 5661 = JCM 6256 TaxID=1423754 RepID=A0A0R1YEH7_9LACO|nr:dihydrodipicolinate synthase family protein [Lactobacillus hamsteri]KRM40721.1 dihydrodipicolinate synthetase family protein [Lactobacillus hamsteri DSM 5661 = JCM 6256]
MSLLENYHIAVPTAFDKNEDLNTEATIKHIQYLNDIGIKSVLVCASTGEQHSLTLKEKFELLDCLSNLNLNEDFNLIFGVSSIRQKEAIQLAKKVHDTPEVSTILIGYSPYILPTQDEALKYTHLIISAAGKPAIIYNNPLRTGFDLSVDSFEKIVNDNDLIVGLKEAGDPHKISEIKKGVTKSLNYYIGGEKELESKIKFGYNSLSSIAGNVYPKEIEQWFSALLNKDVNDNYDDLQIKIDEIFSNSPLPYIKKQISKKEHIDFGICRTPLGN